MVSILVPKRKLGSEDKRKKSIIALPVWYPGKQGKWSSPKNSARHSPRVGIAEGPSYRDRLGKEVTAEQLLAS